jgi:hypothetical protein
LVSYTTHRPSGENTAFVGLADCTAPNGLALLSLSEKNESVLVPPFVSRKRKPSPFGDHDSGTCSVLVRRRQAFGGAGAVGALPEDA